MKRTHQNDMFLWQSAANIDQAVPCATSHAQSQTPNMIAVQKMLSS